MKPSKLSPLQFRNIMHCLVGRNQQHSCRADDIETFVRCFRGEVNEARLSSIERYKKSVACFHGRQALIAVHFIAGDQNTNGDWKDETKEKRREFYKSIVVSLRGLRDVAAGEVHGPSERLLAAQFVRDLNPILKQIINE